MKLRSVALVGVTSLAALGLIGVGAHAVFTTSTQSGQTITAGTGWGSTTGITDPGDPTVALTYPVNGTSYDGASWGRAITGTISDALGSITDLGVSVQQGSDPSSCWTGTASTFTATCPNYVAVATPTTTWSLNLAASYLTSGDTYNAVAKASDSTGNTFVSSSVSLTYNTAAPALPTVNITYPVDGTTYGTDWTGTITGSSLANETGQTISDVQVSIQQVGGSCWTGSGNDYTATCPNYVLVTSGTTSWSVTIPDTDLTNGDTYNLTAEATDGVGNLGTSSTVTFAHDTAVPSVAVIYPVDSTTYGADWTGTVTGTASSNSGDSTAITATALAIEDTTTDAWWNGTSFSNSTQSFETASGTTGWMLTLPASSLTSDNTYSVIAQATDSAGNLGTSPSVSFTYHPHTSPPTATITYPVNNATYGTNWNGTITGAASPSSGGATTITSVSVAIEDTTTGEWWNGTSFAQSFVAATDTATWMLPFGTGNLTLGNTYSVIAQATDNLGNQGASSPVSFTYYVPATPPAATITYPVNNSTYGTSWTGSITGTATSGTGTTISGAQEVVGQLELQLLHRDLRPGQRHLDLVPGLRSREPYLRCQLHRHRPGHRQPPQHGDQLDGELHLQQFPPDSDGRVPGQGHNLRSQLGRSYQGHGLAQRRGRDDSHERVGCHRGHHHQALVERLVVRLHQPDLRGRDRHPGSMEPWPGGEGEPHLRQQLQGHGPGHRQPEEPRHQLDGDLHLRKDAFESHQGLPELHGRLRATVFGRYLLDHHRFRLRPRSHRDFPRQGAERRLQRRGRFGQGPRQHDHRPAGERHRSCKGQSDRAGHRPR